MISTNWHNDDSAAAAAAAAAADADADDEEDDAIAFTSVKYLAAETLDNMLISVDAVLLLLSTSMQWLSKRQIC